MSIKFTVDNNFFDYYDSYPDATIKEKVISAFKTKRFSFYPSAELFTELLGMYHTKRKNLLKKYAKVCLDIMDYRILNAWNEILLCELGLNRHASVFVGSDIVRNIKNIFTDLSGSKTLRDVDIEKLLAYVKKQRETNYKSYKENQQEHFDKLKKAGIKTPKMTFDEFYKQDYTIKIREDTIKRIFERGKKPIHGEKIKEILDNSIKYPYFYTSSRVFMALFYRHVVSRRKVKGGDHYDQYYLIYLTGLDHLVSNDVGLKELATNVFGDSKKVLNFSEFVSML